MRAELGLFALITTVFACSSPSRWERIHRAAYTERVPAQFKESTPVATPEAQWTLTSLSTGNGFLSLHTSEDRVFARSWDGLNGGRVFLTADSGVTWTQVSAADTDIDILAISALGDSILAGTWNGLYQSTTGGTTWSAFAPTGLPADIGINSIANTGTALFAASTGQIYKSSDNGSTWTETSSGIPTTARITSTVSMGATIFLGTDNYGVYLSNDDGVSWAAVNSGLADSHISQLAIIGTRLFAVTLNGTFVSTNSGTSWLADTSGLQGINCLLAVNNLAFAGTDDSGAYVSGDGGATWTSFNTGLPGASRIWSLAAASNSVFAGTSSGVWRTAVTFSANEIP